MGSSRMILRPQGRLGGRKEYLGTPYWLNQLPEPESLLKGGYRPGRGETTD